MSYTTNNLINPPSVFEILEDIKEYILDTYDLVRRDRDIFDENDYKVLGELRCRIEWLLERPYLVINADGCEYSTIMPEQDDNICIDMYEMLVYNNIFEDDEALF